MALSSTAIRRVAQAGDPLEGMVAAPVAHTIRQAQLYAQGSTVARLTHQDGRLIKAYSRLELALHHTAQDITQAAHALTDALERRRQQNLPHTLALVETSAGGLLTQALLTRPGMSRLFKEGHVPYDAHAKQALAATPLEGLAAVSAEMAMQLARNVQIRSGADYVLAETGMAGPPDGAHHSLKNGQCWLALATPTTLHHTHLALSPFLTRREHQSAFALHALVWAKTQLGNP